MTQPKHPPLSVRVPPGLIASIDAAAAQHGVTRNAMLLRFIQWGLERATPPFAQKPKPATPKVQVPKPKPAPKVEKATPEAKPFKSRLKGQWKAP